MPRYVTCCPIACSLPIGVARVHAGSFAPWAGARQETRLGGAPAGSSRCPRAGLTCGGDVAKQCGRGLQVPVGIGDVRVAEVRAEGDHVPSDVIAVALQKRPFGERTP
jgi:hypothetical protein